MPNFSSLAGLEVTEKFVCGRVVWCWTPSGYYVLSNLNVVGFELLLVELSYAGF